jgi:two-component system phosphate regulon sensor histidine kinase PhoR
VDYGSTVPGSEASQASQAEEVERRLAELDMLRRRVLNVIPHALRTPVITCRGLAEALSVASEEEIRREVAPALQRNAALAERLLDDMLLAAGITTALPTESATPALVVATARRVWAEVAGERPLEVEGGGGDDGDDDDVSVRVPGDSLERILHHVLDNAAKYGADPTVLRVGRPASQGMVSIEVESQGAGTAEVTDIGLVTEPFYRGERAVTQVAGLGVGLPVARALAVHAGGSLQVSRGEGGGLVVTVELRQA